MKHVWYKNKTAWLSIIVILFLVIVVTDAITFHSVHKAAHPDDTAIVTNHDESTAAPKHSIRLAYKNYKYSQKKTYQINQDVKGWDDYADVKIKNITVYKLAKAYKDIGTEEEKGNCLVLINMDVKAKQDISFYPTQGSISTNLGKQVEAMDGVKEDWDGDMDQGISKSGDVAAVFANVDNISDIKKLRYKFDAFLQDENNDSDDAEHNFDLNLKLNQQ